MITVVPSSVELLDGQQHQQERREVREGMLLGGEAPPYVWLVEHSPTSVPGTAAVPSVAGGGAVSGWVPLRREDAASLERGLERLQRRAHPTNHVVVNGEPKRQPAAPSTLVPVENGRYDVDLQKRVLRAVYWDEPERRVLRSLWFRGRAGERIPYEEDDAEEIEAALRRLRAGKERAPLLVPVNRGCHDVRFEALLPEKEASNSSTWSFFATSPSPARGSLFGKPAEDSAEDPDGDGDADVAADALDVQYSVVQESVDRTGNQAVLPVWRGYWPEGDFPPEDDEEQLPSRVECLVFVVHGIGQYHRLKDGSQNRFYGDVGKVRGLAVQRLRQRQREELPVPGRVEFLPLEWFESVHVGCGVGNRLKNVTLPSVATLRDFANFAIADIMVYQDDEWRESIHDELKQKMARIWALFCSRTPDYSGEVAVIGHSLGSVIMFDLMQKILPPDSQGLVADGTPATSSAAPAVETEGSLAPGQHCPSPRCLFAVGSPLGMFLSIRLSKRGEQAVRCFRGLDIRWPISASGRGWRLFNIFHPDDPIAYRVEPLLNPAYTSTPPRVVPHQGGLRFHHQMREWAGRWLYSAQEQYQGSDGSSKVNDVLLVPMGEGSALPAPSGGGGSSVTPPTDPSSGGGYPAGTPAEVGRKPAADHVAVDRVDWAIQETPLESMNELLSAMHSHFAYWECEDLIVFAVDKVLESCAAGQK